jgi:hypothetical protein
MALPDFIVGCPVIAPREATAAARRQWNLDSVDIAVVDNSPTGEYSEGAWLYHRDPDGRNLGVAESWNAVLALGADLTIIVSSYLELDDGLATTVERIREAANEFGCVTWAAMHCFAVTRKTVESSGVLDPYYRVGYSEDCDWIYRWELTDCHSPSNPMPKIAVPSTCPQAKTLALGLAKPNVAENRARYIAKWGGDFTKETFTTPFNNPEWGVKDWGYADPPGGGTWQAYIVKEGLE